LKTIWNGDEGQRIGVDLTVPVDGIELASKEHAKPKKLGVLKVKGRWDGNVFAIMGTPRLR